MIWIFFSPVLRNFKGHSGVQLIRSVGILQYFKSSFEMSCKSVNLEIFGLRHESLVNKVKMLLLYPVTLKQLNNGYKGVSVAPVTGLGNLESVFRYINLKHAPTHPTLKRKGKLIKKAISNHCNCSSCSNYLQLYRSI